MGLSNYILLFILFVLRIYGTKVDTSYSEWEEIIKENCKNYKEIKAYGEDVWKVFKRIYFVVMHLYFFLLIGAYKSISEAMNMQIVTILSAVQIVTVFIHYYYWLKTPLCSTRVEDYKFRREWNWFNVILDYIYCPLVFICGLVG